MEEFPKKFLWPNYLHTINETLSHKFHPYSILTGDIMVEFVIYCVLMTSMDDPLFFGVIIVQIIFFLIRCCFGWFFCFCLQGSHTVPQLLDVARHILYWGWNRFYGVFRQGYKLWQFELSSFQEGIQN